MHLATFHGSSALLPASQAPEDRDSTKRRTTTWGRDWWSHGFPKWPGKRRSFFTPRHWWMFKNVQTSDKLPTVVIDASGSFPHQHAASFIFFNHWKTVETIIQRKWQQKKGAAEYMLIYVYHVTVKYLGWWLHVVISESAICYPWNDHISHLGKIGENQWLKSARLLGDMWNS